MVSPTPPQYANDILRVSTEDIRIHDPHNVRIVHSLYFFCFFGLQFLDFFFERVKLGACKKKNLIYYERTVKKETFFGDFLLRAVDTCTNVCEIK